MRAHNRPHIKSRTGERSSWVIPAPGGCGPSNSHWRFEMKIAKRLLLGSTAGLVAISGTQAADLPLKAKPVQYVKICSLYGEGLYYIPGSDVRLKIGGYVQADYGW